MSYILAIMKSNCVLPEELCDLHTIHGINHELLFLLPKDVCDLYTVHGSDARTKRL